QEGFLLPGERSVRQVFGGSRGAHSNRHVLVAGTHFRECLANLLIKRFGELGVHDPLANLRTGLGQGIDVIHIKTIQHIMDTLVQAALLQEIPVGLGSGGETARHRHTSASQVTDHLAQGGVLAPYMLNIVDAELIEGHYVLNQGDLSTVCWDIPGACKHHSWSLALDSAGAVGDNAGHYRGGNAAYHSQESFLT